MSSNGPRMGRAQTAFWRAADRTERLIFYRGWPARLSRFLGFRSPLRIVRHDFVIAELPEGTPQLTVAFASDLHAGHTTDPDLLRRACAAMAAIRPDLLLLGGDFVSLDARQIDWLAPLLGAIDAPLGRFAVLGNHDRWNDGEHVRDALQACGIEVLINESRRLPAPFQDVWICGLDDYLTGEVDVAGAFSKVEGTRVVLMHAPDSLEDLAGERFALALCGHTHGGQLALRDGAAVLSAPGPLSRVYNRGLFRLDHGGVLLVSVGVGCSTLPLRLNSDPEVIVCRLLAPAADGTAATGPARESLIEGR